MKTEFEVFKDVWNVYKKFYFVTDNNEFWDELVNECGKVRDKYKNSNLCSRLLMVIIQDLEERGRMMITECKFSHDQIKKLSKEMVILVDTKKVNDHITNYFDKRDCIQEAGVRF